LKIISFLFFFIGLTNASHSHKSSNVKNSLRSKNNFDYYILATSWTPGYCASHSTASECYNLETRYPYAVSHLVIHGFWPQRRDGSYPSFCAGCKTINSNCNANSIKSQFDVTDKWIKYAPAYDRSTLVDYEWNKHGTCSGLSKLNYFNVELETLRKLGTPKGLIAKKGSSVSYKTLSGYFMSINKTFKPILMCDKNNNLVEVRTCWTLTPSTLKTTQISCSIKDFRAETCSKKENIHIL
jgi:ribonuclease T2